MPGLSPGVSANVANGSSVARKSPKETASSKSPDSDTSIQKRADSPPNPNAFTVACHSTDENPTDTGTSVVTGGPGRSVVREIVVEKPRSPRSLTPVTRAQ